MNWRAPQNDAQIRYSRRSSIANYSLNCNWKLDCSIALNKIHEIFYSLKNAITFKRIGI